MLSKIAFSSIKAKNEEQNEKVQSDKVSVNRIGNRKIKNLLKAKINRYDKFSYLQDQNSLF